jgi:hypothetical protein
MILRPEPLPVPDGRDTVSVWEAIARTQKATAQSYLVVRQPDHARLAAELAQQFSFAGMPAIADDIIRGISLHDEGWSEFDCGRKRLQATPARYDDGVPLNADGKPLCFLDIKAADFLEAWQDSIAVAEEVAPIAGLIVSGHFYRLGRVGLNSGHYSGDDARLVGEFVSQEDQRRERLMKHESRPPAEVEYWTDVLQFCDLLSLYLCCGSQASVEFPQRIAGDHPIRLRGEDGVFVSSPALFARTTIYSLGAYLLTADDPVLLRWTLR